MFNMRRFQNMLLKVFPWVNYLVKEPFTFGVISIFVKLFKGAVSFHLMPFFKVAFLQSDILSTLCYNHYVCVQQLKNIDFEIER
jgi:hypothetical protein